MGVRGGEGIRLLDERPGSPLAFQLHFHSERLVTDSLPQPRRRSWKLIALAAVLVPALLFSIYVGITLSWSYSEGDRVGILQKFSNKGWLCKSWEGDLAMSTVPGVAPTIWNFTVRDDAVAKQVTAALGQRVGLRYAEHRGVPTTCFGDTPYYVDSVWVLQQ